MNGTKVQRPRWKRMLDEQEGYLGDALGQLYVQKYFSPVAKERYRKLVAEIFAAFADRIRALDWMSAPTKERALKKLDAVMVKVGYPDKWKDYSSYEVGRTSFLMNAVRGNAWRSDYYIKKLGKPVDRTEWDMTPQTYNAYYNPSNNEIVLPAAVFILPGIADSLVDDAIVYAYAGGSTIGHEITHGFDDEGRQFDEKGNLKEWWTPEDAKEFTARAARIVHQFDGYIAVDSLHVNGSATQGENIADLGGVQLGWDAFIEDETVSGREAARRPDAVATLLRGMVHQLDDRDPSRERAHARENRRARAEFHESLGAADESAAVLRRVRRAARRQDVSGAGRAGEDLVTPRLR